MSTTSRTSCRTQQGSASPILLLFVALIFFAAGVAVTWWYLTQRPATTTSSAPTPAPDFSPLTPGTAAVAPEAAATAPADAASPVTADAAPALPAAPPPPKAGAAISPRRVTKIPVASPLPQMLPPVGPAAPRTFVLETSVVESLRSVGRDLDGFDTSGIGVKRAPRVDGQIELVMQPPTVEAGQPYSVMVYLKNDGKKPIDVAEMKVSMIVDGQWSTRALPPKTKQIRPKQRVLLEELPGIWRQGVSDWAVEAVVTSKVQDVYRNRLTWK